MPLLIMHGARSHKLRWRQAPVQCRRVPVADHGSICARTRAVMPCLALQINLGKGRVVPIARLRGARRPLILAGSRGYINKCLKLAEQRREELEERGFSSACPRSRPRSPACVRLMHWRS